MWWWHLKICPFCYFFIFFGVTQKSPTVFQPSHTSMSWLSPRVQEVSAWTAQFTWCVLLTPLLLSFEHPLEKYFPLTVLLALSTANIYTAPSRQWAPTDVAAQKKPLEGSPGQHRTPGFPGSWGERYRAGKETAHLDPSLPSPLIVALNI